MDLFIGSLVRLAALDLETASEHFAKWRSNAEYWRLLEEQPPQLITPKQARQDLEEYKPGESLRFMMRTLDDDRVVGFVNLWVEWHDSNAWVGIGIGEREDWSKGYGTDALRIALRYAFTELELHRVSLGVLADNKRAIRAYQKAGFQLEGRVRENCLRDGRQWDDLFMGILREDWLAQRENA